MEDWQTAQQDIIAALGVVRDPDPAAEVERRAGFLADYLRAAHGRCYVLGISGGVDSLVGGCLAQRAVQRLREQGYEARFHAMRLPYAVQKDEDHAQASLRVIAPDDILTVDVAPATDGMRAALDRAGLAYRDPAHADFVKGNIKARQRMIAQYAVAGARGGLVIGTDHAAQALMGFYTKHGDGAADVVPLSGLTKRGVRALAKWLGAPDELVMKTPTADLESESPQKPDEEAFGIPYDALDDFLEGKVIDAALARKIVGIYRATAHKRAMPVAPG